MCKVVNQVNAELQRGLDKVDVSLGGLENDSPACPQGWRTRKGAVGAVSRQMRGVKQVMTFPGLTSPVLKNTYPIEHKNFVQIS